MPISVHTITKLFSGSSLSRSDQLLVGIFESLPVPATANAMTGTTTTITPGAGYTGLPTFTDTVNGGAAMATSLKVVSATTLTGTGFAVNDTVTVTGGAVLRVATVSGGVPTSLTVTTAGTYTTSFPSPVYQTATSGAGVNFSATVSYGVGAVTITNSGSYVSGPAVLPASGGGSPTTVSSLSVSVGDTGAPVVVGVSGQDLPASYMVISNFSQPLADNIVYKSNLGFAVAITPAAGASAAAGFVDVLVIA